jgi:hypothetical protein
MGMVELCKGNFDRRAQLSRTGAGVTHEGRKYSLLIGCNSEDAAQPGSPAPVCAGAEKSRLLSNPILQSR